MELSEYQRSGVEWMKMRERDARARGGILADEMGLGKTAQALVVVLDHAILGDDAREMPTLIITPKVCIPEWQKEMRKLSEVRVHEITKSDTAVVKAAGAVKIASFSTIRAISKGDLSKHTIMQTRWGRLIVDEGHEIRNFGSDKGDDCFGSKIGGSRVRQISASVRWILSATPVQNKIMKELKSLVGFVVKRPPDALTDAEVRALVSGNEEDPSKKLVMRRTLEDVKAEIEHDAPPPPVFKNKVFPAFKYEGERLLYEAIVAYCKEQLASAGPGSDSSARNACILQQITWLRLASTSPEVFLHRMAERKTSENYPIVFDPLVRKYLQQKSQRKDDDTDRSRETMFLNIDLSKDAVFEDIDAGLDPARVSAASQQRPPTAAAAGAEDPLREPPPPQASTTSSSLSSSGAICAMVEQLQTMDLSVSTKLEWACRKIQLYANESRKVIVFSVFREEIRILRRMLHSNGINYAEISGNVSDSDKLENIRSFKDPTNDRNVAIFQIGCGKLGLNLQVADVVFILTPGYNPFDEQQALARAVRRGQKKIVTVYRVYVANPNHERADAEDDEDDAAALALLRDGTSIEARCRQVQESKVRGVLKHFGKASGFGDKMGQLAFEDDDEDDEDGAEEEDAMTPTPAPPKKRRRRISKNQNLLIMRLALQIEPSMSRDEEVVLIEDGRSRKKPKIVS